MATLGLLVLPVLSLPAFAQVNGDPGNKLQAVERKIQSQQAESERQKARADALKTELAAVNAELVAAAKRAQDQEVLVIELEDKLAQLEREANQKGQQLRARRQQFSGVVMALTRIARFPTEALVAQPMPAEDTVRSAILLRAAVPAIETRAKSLQLELQELATARVRVAERRSELQGAVDKLRAEAAGIEAVRKQKAALRAEAISKSRAAQSKAQKLGREAKNLRDLMESLEAERKKAAAEAQKRREAERLAAKQQNKAKSTLHVQPESAPLQQSQDVTGLSALGSIAKARGQLPFPVVGKVVGSYGQALEGGLTSKGLSLEARDGAQVIAPFDGKVVFAGPFRGYGQLLIIDHGEGYHSLLAGLGRIDALIDQPVLAGEPVATMLEGVGSDPGGRPVLYVEFRRDNQPINPLPWLASRKGTPKG
ncbi:MAG TPA: peptidoglycan DD-metalloendopeptidase family protein [Magnetovibrio sp.]